ncbi:hypothetical protein DPMN_068685 [Dreissena polymorpha]|uniref:Uncharacterized protein n=1 Tax=Dreissena polymorpha TaxID=45954 RepID=A0A9D3YXN2_DREPO|nr:hypothetical protein DPMN_068685 [Dreissena polymorpha]
MYIPPTFYSPNGIFTNVKLRHITVTANPATPGWSRLVVADIIWVLAGLLKT